MSVLVQENFIDEDRCGSLIQLFREFDDHGDTLLHGRSTRMVHGDLLGVGDLANQIVKALGSFYGEEISQDQTTLFEMGIGGSQPLHADAEKQDENGEWVGNHCAYRTHVGLLYLTTEGKDHWGGTLRLPEEGFEYPAKAGSLVGFPATHEYVHEVTPVTHGLRYVLAVWTR